MTNNDIETIIEKSQHCQRNWDLTKSIPQADLDTLASAVTQCPSKQNVAYYKCHFITNRNIIEAIHGLTDGFTVNREKNIVETNTQTLANLLVVFEDQMVTPVLHEGVHRNDQMAWLEKDNERVPDALYNDREVSLGIASGYLNLTANLLGYSSGYCGCFDGPKVQKVLGTEGGVLLLLGIGFPDPTKQRTQHQVNENFNYITFPKQKIEVNFVK
jgi:nitroreductase